MRPKSRVSEGGAVTLGALIKTDICVIGAGSAGLSVTAWELENYLLKY